MEEPQNSDVYADVGILGLCFVSVANRKDDETHYQLTSPSWFQPLDALNEVEVLIIAVNLFDALPFYVRNR
jgi:hypothetical protein